MNELITIDISKLKFQKETPKSYVFLSGTMRRYKGEFTEEALYLPKSMIGINRYETNLNNVMVPKEVTIPAWLYKENIKGTKKLEKLIRTI